MFPFVLVQGDDVRVRAILREVSLLPGPADEEFAESDIEYRPSAFSNLWWVAINSCSFPLFNCSTAFNVSCSVGVLSNSLAFVGCGQSPIVGLCGRR